MFSPSCRLFSARTAQICSRCLRTASAQPIANRFTPIRYHAILSRSRTVPSPAVTRSFNSTSRRPASAPTATEAMERIEELYENATEEFQIAAEETEGNTVYASEDRAAAKAEVEKLQEFYKSVVEGTGYDASVREEVKRRAGQRVRELMNAMMALEEKAMNQD